VRLLKVHAIVTVADVRSQPYGRLEHFRREPLASALEAAGIHYEFLGEELGARRSERECYENGQAVYERVAKLPAFLTGVARLETLAAESPTTMMCAERDPLDCHRTVLVARELVARGWQVRHILGDGKLAEHSTIEQRMIEQVGYDPLFDAVLSKCELTARAYRERGREIAYRSYAPSSAE
jgi:uncharacterized protein (DUF488 family)